MLIQAADSASLHAAGSRIREWRKDPRLFVRQAFSDYWNSNPSERISPWQDESLASLLTHQRLALQACKGPGKTTDMSWAAWWFLSCWPHPNVVATSVTKPNLRDGLWKELALWRNRSPFLTQAFEWTQERIFARHHPETWFASARTWSRDADADQLGQTLAGLHSDFMLFLLDEAGGIPFPVLRAAHGGMSVGKLTRILIGGNPTHLHGYCLYEAAVRRRPSWKVFEITGDPDDPQRAPRVSAKWARELIADYGRESSLVQVDVLGKFPTGETDALISRAKFEDAFSRWDERERLATEPRTLGVDVARKGPDSTVVCFRAGDVVERFERWQGQDTVYTTGRVKELAAEHGATAINVDDVGVGGGVTDQLRADGLPVNGIDVGTASSQPTKHINLRSELNLAMQERFRQGLIAIEPTIRDRTRLLAEGTSLRVGYSTGSRRKIESKDEYKARMGGLSPDHWDATVLAFADQVRGLDGFLDFLGKQRAA